LTHILELIKDHTPFIQDYVQSVVEDTEFKDYDIKVDGKAGKTFNKDMSIVGSDCANNCYGTAIE